MAAAPSAPRSRSRVAQPRPLQEWLESHATECASRVEMWMIRSLPVAAKLVAAVWRDPAWTQALRHAVIWPMNAAAQPEAAAAGFLSGASPERGLGLVTLDGETSWLNDVEAIGIAHPVLLPNLEEFREFATELGLDQHLHQLHRETWSKPAETDERSVDAFAGGRFPQLIQATNRARAAGYSIRGGYAVCRVWDDGSLVEARYWIGSDLPTNPGQTGNLEWVGPEGQSLRLGQLGPVVYSEGMRMAARIYAGRTADFGQT